jgi:hypothetical protein
MKMAKSKKNEDGKIKEIDLGSCIINLDETQF